MADAAQYVPPTLALGRFDGADGTGKGPFR